MAFKASLGDAARGQSERQGKYPEMKHSGHERYPSAQVMVCLWATLTETLLHHPELWSQLVL